MAATEVTAPIILDSTGQTIATALQSLAANNVKMTASTTDLEDGVSSLPTGQLYLVYDE